MDIWFKKLIKYGLKLKSHLNKWYLMNWISAKLEKFGLIRFFLHSKTIDVNQNNKIKVIILLVKNVK